MRLAKYVVAVGLVLGMGCVNAMAEVVAVVSAKNPVTTLSRNQVADIFLGRSSRFPNGVQAVPIDQPEGSPLRDEFYRAIAGKSPAQIKAHWSKIIFTGRGQPPRDVANGAEVKKFLADSPAAIGYIDGSALDASVKALTISP